MKRRLPEPAAAGPTPFVAQRIEPTAEQLAIQTATHDTLIVEANAGAAKTTSLALRLAESMQRGMPPDKALVLTATEPACDAMRAALKKIGVPFDLSRRLRILTFEAFATSVLRGVEGAAVESLDTPEALEPFVREAIRRVDDNPEERWRDALQFPASGDATVEVFLRESLHLKGSLQLDAEGEGDAVTPGLAERLGRNYAVLKTFRAYERLRRGGHPDRPMFRGASDATYDLAQQIWHDQFDADNAAWPRSLRVLLLDEMHDVNQAMFVMLRQLLLSNPAAYFCGAGDRDQVIHKLAGAEARFMGDQLAAETPRTIRRLPLTASYRFGAKLATMAGWLAGKPYASASAHDTAVVVVPYADAAACDAAVVEQALAWKEKHGGKRMADLAVLLRHGHQSVALENRLLDAGLPYLTRGFASYLHRPEVLLVRGLLAVATDDFSNVQDADTRRRILEAFVFFCDVRITVREDDEGDQAGLLREAVQAAAEHPSVLSMFFEHQVLRNADADVRKRLLAALKVARESHAGAGMLARCLDALQPRWLAARVLIEQARVREVAANLDALQFAAAPFDSAAAFFRSLNDAELRQRGMKDAQSLVIASVESVKGLEFDHVLLPHLARGTFPDAEAALDEERNLFYVAITRARERLTLFAHAAGPSRFIADMAPAPKRQAVAR